jgi:hypothetical protein
MNMARLLIILLVGLVFEAIGVVLLSRGLKEINWFFYPAEIKDLPALVARLRLHSDPVSQFLWEKMNPDQQALLATRDPSPRQPKVVTQALNAELNNRSLFRPDRFAHVALPSEAQELSLRTQEGEDLVRLNRSLLESAYPSELSTKESKTTLGLIRQGLTDARILFGVFFEALFFVSLLILMSRADVSFVWPLTSLSFVFATIAAKTYLGEHVSPLRWSGVCLIMVGAAIITWTEKHKNSDPTPLALHESAGQGRSADQ